MSLGLGNALVVAALSIAGATAPNHHRPGKAAQAVSPRASSSPRRSEHERESESALPPALLTTPAYYGTLAAVRALGRSSIPVTTAGPDVWAIAAWSKYATNHVECPRTTDTSRFMAWLLDFGRRQSVRHVLLPTCDDTAWLYALHREKLAEHFYVGPSTIETIHGLLHKGHLAEHARQVGLETPRTWYPRSEADIREIAKEATFPVLVKPVTQVLFESRSKGRRADRAEELLGAYESYRDLVHGKAIVEYDATSAYPMIQEYFPGAARGIYNISSYAENSKLIGARAGRKILQRPRQFGTGVCFEEAPLDPELLRGLERLVERVGFSGVSETEYVQADGRSVLIDFNPRFYNQMSFDVARGLPLPTLAYFGALRRETPPALRDAAAAAELTDRVFTYGSAFQVMIKSQRLSRAISAEEAEGWLDWYDAHEGRRVDAVADDEDPWPAHMDRMQMVKRHMRHPRDFVRTIVLNR